MRKMFFAAIMAACLVLTGCSGVSQEKYDDLVNQKHELVLHNNELDKRIDALTNENQTLKDEFNNTNAELNKIKKELDELKEIQEEYNTIISSEEYQQFMQLSEQDKAAEIARAEKERLEAEQAAIVAQEEAERLEAERKAQEEAERLAAEQARLAEEAKGYETGITYTDISRSPDLYKGEKVKFSGNVLQIMEGYVYNEGRMSTNGSYDDVVYIRYDADMLDFRLLEDDSVTIYGIFDGLHSYTTILGATVTLPIIKVDRIELVD